MEFLSAGPGKTDHSLCRQIGFEDSRPLAAAALIEARQCDGISRLLPGSLLGGFCEGEWMHRDDITAARQLPRAPATPEAASPTSPVLPTPAGPRGDVPLSAPMRTSH